MATAMRLVVALCLTVVVAGPATAVIVQHVSNGTDYHVSTWRGGYNYSSNWGYIQKWPGANTDGSLGEFSRTEVQSAIDATKATHGGWDAKVIVSQVSWVGTTPPANLDPIAASVDIDLDTMVWGTSTYYTAGGGNWMYGGATYSNFVAAVNAGVAAGDSMVVDSPSWQAVWDTSLPVACWNVEIDVPESLVQHFLYSASSDGFFVSAKNGPVSIFSGDQWNQQANIRVAITQPPQTGPWVSVSAELLDMLMHKTSPVSAPQSVTVSNAGTGSLAWTAAESPNVAWMSLTNTSGSAGDSFEVTLDVSSLAAGNYSGKVVVTDGGATNSPVEVWVNVAVFDTATPTIELSPTSVSAQATPAGSNPAPIPVTVNNVAFGSLNWTAQVQGSVSWLSVANGSGTDGGVFQVMIDKSGMAGGSYSANIEVTDPTASNSPVILPVSFDLREQDASIPTANGYDDAWEDGVDGWVAAQQAIHGAQVGGTTGFVVHLGDSITYQNQYGRWAHYGSGKTADDIDICNWMHSNGDWSSGTNSGNNGWYLAAYDYPGRNGSFTARSGIRTDQYIVGGTPLPSIDEMFTAGFSNPDGKQYRDAQIAVMMLGTNDASANRSATAVEADLNTLVDRIQAANVIVCLSTLPPKRGDMADVQAINAAIRSICQTRKLPMIDYYEECMRRRPGTTWDGTLISSDGVHPTGDSGAYTPTSDPYAGDGVALSWSGCLLRGWLSVQKIREIREKVINAQPPAPELVSSDPPDEGTFAKQASNVLLLTFDNPITSPALYITVDGINYDLSSNFTTSIEPDGVTLKVVENGDYLLNMMWARFEPAPGFAVGPFSVDVCKLIGDSDGDGTVGAFDLGVSWSHVNEQTDERYDTDGDGTVGAFDLGVAWSHVNETTPPNPHGE